MSEEILRQINEEIQKHETALVALRKAKAAFLGERSYLKPNRPQELSEVLKDGPLGMTEIMVQLRKQGVHLPKSPLTAYKSVYGTLRHRPSLFERDADGLWSLKR